MQELFRQGRVGEKLPFAQLQSPIATPSFFTPFYIDSMDEKRGYTHFPVHTHPGLEISSCISGKTTFYSNGMYYDFLPGDCYFTNAIVPHTTLLESENYHFIYIHFSESQLLTIPPPDLGFELLKLFFMPLTTATPVLIGKSNIASLLQECLNSFSSVNRYGKIVSWCKMVEALTEIATVVANAQTMSVPDMYNEQKILRAVEYIHNHFREKIVIDKVAEYCGLSAPHFFRLFKEKLHATPYDYCIHLRVTNAMEQIKNTEKKIENIAFDCGFNNISNFRKTFSDLTGFSPSHFRP